MPIVQWFSPRAGSRRDSTEQTEMEVGIELGFILPDFSYLKIRQMI